MPNISPTEDGGGGQQTATTAAAGIDSWVAVRSDTSGNQNMSTSTFGTSAVSARTYTYSTFRQMWIMRSFFTFDTSGITATPTDANLVLYGYSSWSDDIIAVKHSNSGTLSSANWTGIDGCSSQTSNTDGSGAGTFASCATIYSSVFAAGSGNTGQYNSISLNSTALTDMTNNDEFKIALVQYDNDYLDITSYPSNSSRVGFYFSEDTDGGRDPYLSYTEAPVDATNFNTVSVKKSNLSMKGSSLKIK